MTKEEAIEWLNTDISRLWNTPMNNLHKEALEMAINALEQEPCDDAISRQAVLDQMYEWMNTCEYRKVNATDYFVNRINKLPPVNPQPCEDAISRQATLEPYKILDDTDTLCVATIRANILQQPSVNPTKTGHWECNELFYEGESRGAIITCSKCGNEFKVSPKVFENLYDNEKFCNHCGCRMVEPQESEE